MAGKLNSLYALANNISYRSTLPVINHADISCTSESHKHKIESDLIVSTYNFVETHDTKNLLYALAVAKKSSYKFEKVMADEYTYDSTFQAYLKIGFHFSNNGLRLNCKVRKFICETAPVTVNITSSTKKYANTLGTLIRQLREIESAYKQM